MAHVPVRDLVQEARDMASMCLAQAFGSDVDKDHPVIVDEFAMKLAGMLANHADHVESLLNDGLA
jgi:hypothetical protein